MGRIVTLYHGTDARMVTMTKDERQNFLSMVNRLVSNLWAVYRPYYVDYVPVRRMIHGEMRETYIRAIEQYKDLFEKAGKIDAYYCLTEKLSMLEARDNGFGYYQYGSLYFAATEKSAGSYARRSFAGGESGLIAFRMLEAMEILQFPEWKPDEQTQQDIVCFRDFSNKENADPVIVTIDGIDSDNLLSEDGNAPSFFFDVLDKFGVVSDCKFRYKGDLDLSQYPMTHLNNNA